LSYSLNDASIANQREMFDFRGASLMLGQVWEVISAATRGNISIYAIDPRGTTTMGAEDIEIASLPQPTSGLGPRSLSNEALTSQFMLRQLAETTGGFAAVNVNDFD